MKKEVKLANTPLQRILGFEVAEEIYDLLPLHAQVILDLKIEGYHEQDIGEAMGISQQYVSKIFRQSRAALLKSKLHLILEARQHYRETNPIVMDNNYQEEEYVD